MRDWSPNPYQHLCQSVEVAWKIRTHKTFLKQFICSARILSYILTFYCFAKGTFEVACPKEQTRANRSRAKSNRISKGTYRHSNLTQNRWYQSGARRTPESSTEQKICRRFRKGARTSLLCTIVYSFSSVVQIFLPNADLDNLSSACVRLCRSGFFTGCARQLVPKSPFGALCTDSDSRRYTHGHGYYAVCATLFHHYNHQLGFM